MKEWELKEEKNLTSQMEELNRGKKE